MLKRNNKRVAGDFQFNLSVDEEAKLRLEHQKLLHKFLELQKIFVAKKKRLQMVKEKRETLWDEVRFLRQRHAYLTKTQSHNLEEGQDHVLTHNFPLQSVVVEELPRINKKSKDCTLGGRRVGKKKVSWQDQKILKVKDQKIGE